MKNINTESFNWREVFTVLQYLFMLLPLLILCLPTNVQGIFLGLLLYILVCFAVSKYCKKHDITSSYQLKNIVVLVIVSAALGCIFYKRWIPSEKVMMLASLLHIQVNLFLGLISAGVSVVAVWSLNAAVPVASKWKQQEVLYYASQKRTGHVEEKSWKSYIMIFFIATAIITICSKCSPIYPFNDWVDANAFFTVGKSVLNGMVPYRDLFEHKGPILYALHTFAAIISYDSFLGIYFLEILSCFAFLILCLYILRMYIDSDKEIIVILSIVSLFIYTSKAFYYGDSAEEFCMPFLAYALWVSVKSLKKEQLPSAKEGFWIGITSACVLWIKFNILGFYMGWIIVPFYLAIKNKQLKALAKFIGSVIAGITGVTIPLMIYFGVNHAIVDWMKVYFYDNLFSYTTSKSTVAVFAPISNLLDGLLIFEVTNPVVLIFIIFGIIWCIGCEKKIVLLNYLFTFIFLFLFIFIGGRYFYYYSMIFSVFCVWGAVWLADIFRKYLYGHLKKGMEKIHILYYIAFCLLLFILSPNTAMLKYDKSDLPQYKVKNEIEKCGIADPTLLNYGCLDVGVYTVCGIRPTCKYFYSSNLGLPEIEEEQRYFIDNKLVDFIVTTKSGVDFKSYDLVESYDYDSDGLIRPLYLYKIKD